MPEEAAQDVKITTVGLIRLSYVSSEIRLSIRTNGLFMRSRDRERDRERRKYWGPHSTEKEARAHKS